MTHLDLRDISPEHAESELVRHIGFTYEDVSSDSFRVRIIPSVAAVTGSGSKVIDRRTLVAVSDHVMGLAIHLALGQKAPLATIDLNFGHMRPLEAGDVFIRLNRPTTVSRIAFVSGTVDQGDTSLPAGSVTSRFLIGAWPGGTVSEFPPPADMDVYLEGVDSFAAFAGLPAAGAATNDFDLQPHPRTIGARSVPAFHGGIVAAGLATSAAALAEKERGSAALLRSEAINYLRAAFATTSIQYRSEIISSGRNLMRIRASAHQNGDARPVAQSLVLFEIA
ncbi:PaaI family thioesterase [Brevundimonas abyssalis]|uniref:PaaI family thioesterase n=1 Tax=Brevundimonas abyssalis TaxID=1125965 RepID=UPI0005EBFE4E|nr:acyl-CoA thioesterase domain-containing protein [Brevundimonas abyssalis]